MLLISSGNNWKVTDVIMNIMANVNNKETVWQTNITVQHKGIITQFYLCPYSFKLVSYQTENRPVNCWQLCSFADSTTYCLCRIAEVVPFLSSRGLLRCSVTATLDRPLSAAHRTQPAFNQCCGRSVGRPIKRHNVAGGRRAKRPNRQNKAANERGRSGGGRHCTLVTPIDRGTEDCHASDPLPPMRKIWPTKDHQRWSGLGAEERNNVVTLG